MKFVLGFRHMNLSTGSMTKLVTHVQTGPMTKLVMYVQNTFFV